MGSVGSLLVDYWPILAAVVTGLMAFVASRERVNALREAFDHYCREAGKRFDRIEVDVKDAALTARAIAGALEHLEALDTRLEHVQADIRELRNWTRGQREHNR